MSNFDSSHTGFGRQSNSNSLKIANVSAGSENIEQCQILTPLIPLSDVDQTQTQLKIANVFNQTHIRHIDRGILPV